MNLQELKIKVQELVEELGNTPEKMGAIIGNLSSEALRKALNGENEADSAKIEGFFTAREHAFSAYTVLFRVYVFLPFSAAFFQSKPSAITPLAKSISACSTAFLR